MCSNVCRACLRPLSDPNDVVHIFEQLYKNKHNIALLLSDIIRLKIEQTDDISRELCHSCADKVLDFHEFYTMFLESDVKLRELLRITVDKKPEGENVYNHFEDIFVEPSIYGENPPTQSDASDTKAVSRRSRGPERKVRKIDSGCPDGPDGATIATSTMAVPDQQINAKWECYKCHIELESYVDLLPHSKQCKSNQKENWHCNCCDQVFSTRYKLYKHKDVQHGTNKRFKGNYHINDRSQYVCNICNKTFHTRVMVYEHIRQRHSRKELCNICGKFLSDRNNLRKHHRTVHLKEKKYPCTLCDKRYDSSYRLRIHQNSHKGIRNYSCNLCTRTYFTSSCLAAHKTSVHNAEKKHVCSICSRSFSLAYNMRIHMSTHTGIRAHICPHCGLGFQRKNKFLNHIKEVHET